MAKLFISLTLWGATSSIPVMKMLAEQAETNITLAISKADSLGAVTEDEFEDVHEDEEGNLHPYTVTYFTCGSCSGIDADDVKFEYKHLITQLTRRSAFLTMFGLFESHMVSCLGLMDKLSGEMTKKHFKSVDDCHSRLTSTIGGKGIKDIDHLTVIRNIMAHNDGEVEKYHALVKSNVKKSKQQNRQISGILRAMNENAGITVNDFNGVLMGGHFLDYVVGEFTRYVGELEAAVQQYQSSRD